MSKNTKKEVRNLKEVASEYAKEIKFNEIENANKQLKNANLQGIKAEVLILDCEIKRADLFNESFKWFETKGQQLFKNKGHKVTKVGFAKEIHEVGNDKFYQAVRIGKMNKANRKLYREGVEKSLFTRNLKQLDQVAKSERKFKKAEEIAEFLKPIKKEDTHKILYSFRSDANESQVKAIYKSNEQLTIGNKNDLKQVKEELEAMLKIVNAEIDKTAKVVEQYEKQKNKHFKKAKEVFTESEILQGATVELV